SPLLILHISGGVGGLLSGAGAMIFRKGSRGHRIAGNVFFVSMLTMSSIGAYMAFMKSQVQNVFGGLLTFYLVATAWLTARRRNGETGIVNWLALLGISGIGAGLITYGIKAASSPTGSIGGVPAGMLFFLAFVALLCAAGDIRMLVRGSLTATQRITRHLWRMCFALFIAAGSLFLARPRLFPVFFRRAHLLELLTYLPLLLMIFWLIRIRFKNGYRVIKPLHHDSQIPISFFRRTHGIRS
ncbi:MAG: hypothetical protein ACRD3J_04500, partial [Thermoanaerobaculia bacterium]